MNVYQVQYHTSTHRKMVVVVVDEANMGGTQLKEEAVRLVKSTDSGFTKLIQVTTLYGGDVCLLNARPL